MTLSLDEDLIPFEGETPEIKEELDKTLEIVMSALEAAFLYAENLTEEEIGRSTRPGVFNRVLKELLPEGYEMGLCHDSVENGIRKLGMILIRGRNNKFIFTALHPFENSQMNLALAKQFKIKECDDDESTFKMGGMETTAGLKLTTPAVLYRDDIADLEKIVLFPDHGFDPTVEPYGTIVRKGEVELPKVVDLFEDPVQSQAVDLFPEDKAVDLFEDPASDAKERDSIRAVASKSVESLFEQLEENSLGLPRMFPNSHSIDEILTAAERSGDPEFLEKTQDRCISYLEEKGVKHLAAGFAFRLGKEEEANRIIEDLMKSLLAGTYYMPNYVVFDLLRHMGKEDDFARLQKELED